jgi:putative SOS response-associated peptidase YedK
MCGRYGLKSPVQALAERFEVEAPENRDWEAQYNLAPGDFAPVISNQQPHKLQWMQFGLSPHWASKRMYLFNARAEGDLNPNNHLDYQAEKGIAQKPAFRQAIRSQRCIIPADYFVEGPEKEKLNLPFVIRLKTQDILGFAGIWDAWLDKTTGELIHTFAIITITANSLLQKIGHHRSPVILLPQQEKKWLSQLPLPEVLAFLMPYPSDLLEAYPISNAIKSPRANGADLIEKIGDFITN